MRSTALLSLAVLTALSTSSFAITEEKKIACRDFASAVADEWASDMIYRAGDDDMPEASEVLVIAGGKKYFVPREGRGVIKSVATRIYQRKQIFHEEYARCLKGGHVTLQMNRPDDGAANN